MIGAGLAALETVRFVIFTMLLFLSYFQFNSFELPYFG